MLYLVRHAKAGHRDDSAPDDSLRPLTKAGWEQAEALAKRLAKRGATTLVSSPYVRCMQTLEPLAKLLSSEVRADERLAEGMSFAGALDLIESLPDGAVLCSHGDLIPETMDALVRRGCAITSEPDWRKATTWVLRREESAITSAKCWPPPDA